MATKLSKKRIHDDIIHEARVLGLHSGIAEMMAGDVADKVMAWAKRRSAITEDDLNNRIAKEVSVFNQDLAYLFESRNKIM